MNLEAQGRPFSRRERIGLLAVFALALAARSLDFERVLLPDGEVVFAVGDAFYHARRALYSFLEFPDLLRFDPCINYPDGARIPHPPLLDWGTAAFARLIGRDVSTFEHVAAWTPVLLASLSVFPIVALGRCVASIRVGLLAALIYALIPICINYGQLGNFDHHALAGPLGACLVLVFVRILRIGAGGDGNLLLAMVTLAVLRAVMMLTWTGSLLYLIPGDAAVLAAASWTRDARLSKALGLGALTSAVLVLPYVAWLGEGPAGAFASVELSQLHVLLYVCCGALGLANGFAVARWPDATARRSLVRLAIVALPVAGASLLIPGVWAGLRTGLQFLGARDGYTETVIEQLPIFWGEGRYSVAVAHARMGALVYLMPLVPFAFLRLTRTTPRDFSTWFLACWTMLFAYLAMGQVRYAFDFAPAGCVGFALIFAELAAWLNARRVLPAHRDWVAAMLAAAFLAPSIGGFYAPLFGLVWHGARGDLDGVDRALLSIPGSQMRFAQIVAEATAMSGRCEPDSSARPAYGILAHVGLGHALHYSGQRATPADPFGPYIGQRNFDSAQQVLQSTHEHRAARLLEGLSARYVATAADSIPRPKTSLLVRLHQNDGSFKDAIPQLGRFRLVSEGPLGGLAMSSMFGDEPQNTSPYKLFEFVPGAVIELQSEVRSEMTVELPLKTPSGRGFVWRGAGKADDRGRIRIRVPYANPAQNRRAELTKRVKRVVPLGPYKVRVGDRHFNVHVSEQQIQEGATVFARRFEDARIEAYSR